jgi:hypothetical protein
MAEDKKDPFDGEYIGNIFGWKFSIIGLILILLLGGLMLYRHCAMDVPFGLDSEAKEEIEVR